MTRARNRYRSAEEEEPDAPQDEQEAVHQLGAPAPSTTSAVSPSSSRSPRPRTTSVTGVPLTVEPLVLPRSVYTSVPRRPVIRPWWRLTRESSATRSLSVARPMVNPPAPIGDLAHAPVWIGHAQADLGHDRLGHLEDACGRRVGLPVVVRRGAANRRRRDGAFCAARDRVGEPGVHADVRAQDRRVGDDVHPGPVDQRVVVSPGEGQRGIGQLRRECPGHLAEPGQVIRMEAHHESVRDERAIRGGQSLAFHRPLDPPLHLHRLKSGFEQAG